MESTPRISDSEWEVMKILWRQAPCTAQTVIEALADSRDWTAATIKTLLNRLVHKGALRFEKEGRAYVYSPAVSETACRHTVATSFLDRVFDGGLSPLLAHFVKQGRRLSAGDIAELEKILTEARKKP
jgi:BlaI family penicillinase repressor